MVFNQLTIIIIFILSMFLLATIESLIVFPQSRTLFRFRGCHSWDRIRRWHGLKNRSNSRTKPVSDVLLTISRGQEWAKFCEHVMLTDRGNWLRVGFLIVSKHIVLWCLNTFSFHSYLVFYFDFSFFFFVFLGLIIRWTRIGKLY